MTDLQERILIWIVIALAGCALCIMLYVGVDKLLNYEGYFCQPSVVFNHVQTLNTYCGHDWTYKTNSSGTFAQIKGWAFGDFP